MICASGDAELQLFAHEHAPAVQKSIIYNIISCIMHSRNEVTSEAAAKGGHLDVLKWALANGCKWKPNNCLMVTQDSATTEGSGFANK